MTSFPLLKDYSNKHKKTCRGKKPAKFIWNFRMSIIFSPGQTNFCFSKTNSRLICKYRQNAELFSGRGEGLKNCHPPRNEKFNFARIAVKREVSQDLFTLELKLLLNYIIWFRFFHENFIFTWFVPLFFICQGIKIEFLPSINHIIFTK